MLWLERILAMSRACSPMEWSLEAFEIRPCLWKLVEELVAESERHEIKEALGEDLVDETLDLHEEVKLHFSFEDDLGRKSPNLEFPTVYKQFVQSTFTCAY